MTTPPTPIVAGEDKTAERFGERAIASWRKAAQGMIEWRKKMGGEVPPKWNTDATKLLELADEILAATPVSPTPSPTRSYIDMVEGEVRPDKGEAFTAWQNHALFPHAGPLSHFDAGWMARKTAEGVWETLFRKVSRALKCLPSSFPDAQDHVFKKIEALMAGGDALPAGVEPPFAWHVAGLFYKSYDSIPAALLPPADAPQPLYLRAAIPQGVPVDAAPVATVYTMEALVPGGEVKHHVTLHRAVPAGTKLYLRENAP